MQERIIRRFLWNIYSKLSDWETRQNIGTDVLYLIGLQYALSAVKYFTATSPGVLDYSVDKNHIFVKRPPLHD